MQKIDRTTFIGIYTYLILTAIWTILCVVTNEFTKNDKGFISGLGFLIIFTISIFLTNYKIKLRQLLYSAIIVSITFFVASFLVGLFSIWLIWLFDLPEFTNKTLFVVLSSAVASIGLSLMIKYIYKVDKLKISLLMIFIAGVLSSILIEMINNKLFFDYNIPTRVTMFVAWQSLAIIPIFYLINENNLNDTARKKTHYNNT
ncbi:hypothetical protein DFQ03_0478 [Maribacter caenipelagi]|uniref:Uncharacterized protein n=1 Tax=Maribacter caenipelagi TaxID=1447781 RepID=A0A4V3E2W6_9FLAO|nr:hypothetical protein [Maribacter caenipelagi]TDS18768.1 hypothetical protein DFQ03_0478 [Maribacter caenipelagi]